MNIDAAVIRSEFISKVEIKSIELMIFIVIVYALIYFCDS